MVGWLNGILSGSEAVSRAAGIPTETRFIQPDSPENFSKRIAALRANKSLTPAEKTRKIKSLMTQLRRNLREQALSKIK